MSYHTIIVNSSHKCYVITQDFVSYLMIFILFLKCIEFKKSVWEYSEVDIGSEN